MAELPQNKSCFHYWLALRYWASHLTCLKSCNKNVSWRVHSSWHIAEIIRYTKVDNFITNCFLKLHFVKTLQEWADNKAKNKWREMKGWNKTWRYNVNGPEEQCREWPETAAVNESLLKSSLQIWWAFAKHNRGKETAKLMWSFFLLPHSQT